MTVQLNGYRRVIFAMAMLVLMAGCQGLTASHPPVPIHYVAIEDGVSDTDLHTKVGEEVRWVNVRAVPVAVIFSGLVRDDLSCKRGFAKDEAARITAIILPDQYASLCFSKRGHKTYRVLDIRQPSFELNYEVTVEVIEAR